MTTYDDRRLWPGTVPPVAGSPERRPGSVRRTTNVDLVRPDGPTGPLVVLGAGRDLHTGSAGGGVLAQAATEVAIDYLGGRIVRSVMTDPVVDGVEALVGARVGSGFRRTLAEALPDLARGHGLVHLLLDELTPATLISGSTLAREGAVALAGGPGATMPIDICAGWVADGAMVHAIADTGIPLLGWGPPAPSLDRPGDPDAWHPMPVLAPRSMRRRRLLDVGAGPASGPAGDSDELLVQVRFRDSYWEADGTETVVHEYGVTARVDPSTWLVTGAEAVPGPLPAPECPSAAASAGRLVGRRVDDLREVVRAELTGVSTCTHLNDVFRSLADIPDLWTAAAR
ncbi:MAG TPA: DUF2889 domain-containing protein [Aquihabitans sp.]|nr:DUF2889 domain-containing protein [Aquihabitans sp.]